MVYVLDVPQRPPFANRAHAPPAQVAYQLKLLTTAFFSVTMMKRHISLRRWLALGILFIGIVLVQSPQVQPLERSISPNPYPVPRNPVTPRYCG